MHTTHFSSTRAALYYVFIAPTLPANRTVSALPISSKPLARPANRSFTTTRPQLAKTRAPEQRAHKWNEEIRGAQIFLVSNQNSELSDLRLRRTVLDNLDLNTHRLVQVDEQPDPNDPESGRLFPVCKIQDKKEMYQQDMKRKLAQKESKKASAVASSVKTMELNWAIDGNDLGHRLGRMKEFLAEGRKVEVVLAAKKAGRKANTSECEDVFRKIKDAVDAVPGAKEAKALEGKMGQFCTILFQGRPPQAQTRNAGGQKAQQNAPAASAG